MKATAYRRHRRGPPRGRAEPLPDHRFPLGQIATANEAIDAGTTGKILVQLPH